MPIKLITLQAGHENITANCDPRLQSGTGAPGERDFTIRIRNRLSDILLSKKGADGRAAFQLRLVDANFNCDPANSNDYDLFLAIHYDADIYGKGGGIIGIPDASIDFAHAESVRIKKALDDTYFINTGIENHPERLNPNISFYYMWASLSAKTPCVLIECGVGQNAHDKVILADIDRVCNAIARGICGAFNVPFDSPVPPPPLPIPAPQPTPAPPTDTTQPPPESEVLKAIIDVVDSRWTWFGPDRWQNKHQELVDIVNGE